MPTINSTRLPGGPGRNWSREEDLVCTNYILVETFALVQHRLGVEAVRTLQEDIVPVLHIEWMDAQSHNTSVAALLTAARRHLRICQTITWSIL
jgi:hypothetical protein